MSRVPGTFKNRPVHPTRDRSPEGVFAEELLRGVGASIAQRFVMGECLVMLTYEPCAPPDSYWHISVSHPYREPTWDEIKTAVYDIDQARAVMSKGFVWTQILGRVGEGEWVNVHDNCFHLYAIHDPFGAGDDSRSSLAVVPHGPDEDAPKGRGKVTT